MLLFTNLYVNYLLLSFEHLLARTIETLTKHRIIYSSNYTLTTLLITKNTLIRRYRIIQIHTNISWEIDRRILYLIYINFLWITFFPDFKQVSFH